MVCVERVEVHLRSKGHRRSYEHDMAPTAAHLMSVALTMVKRGRFARAVAKKMKRRITMYRW